MKVIRAMLPWTSRPIMAWLTFTQPLQAQEFWCLPLCVFVSASLCLSQRRNLMSNRVSAHTTGLREQRDKSAFLQSLLFIFPLDFFMHFVNTAPREIRSLESYFESLIHFLRLETHIKENVLINKSIRRDYRLLMRYFSCRGHIHKSSFWYHCRREHLKLLALGNCYCF